MANNFLKLNEDKTEILLVSPRRKRETLFNNLEKLIIKSGKKARVIQGCLRVGSSGLNPKGDSKGTEKVTRRQGDTN